MTKVPTVLCIIPARAGSKRIPGKNTKKFVGRPLIAYAIEQAKKLAFVNRVVVDTDSIAIATLAKKLGAEVPFLRPVPLASDTAKVVDSVLYLLMRLKKEEHYTPNFILLLQTTSPLRELQDIYACWNEIQKGNTDAVLTVAPTHPQLYTLRKGGILQSANKTRVRSSNMQAWPESYLLNGCFAYIIRTKVFLRDKTFQPKNTAAVLCPRWRSVDLDTKEDWVMGEFLYRNKKKIAFALKNFT